METLIVRPNCTALIADDKEVVRVGLCELLTDNAGCKNIYQVADGRSAVEETLSLRPEIVLVKKDLPGLDGVAVTQEIKRVAPEILVIMILANPEDIWSVLSSEADGYLCQDFTSSVFSHAVSMVSQGRKYLGPLICDYLLRDGLQSLRSAVTHRNGPRVLEVLSPREKDVIKLMSDGQSNEQIAGSLGLSIQTVKVHVKHILRKLKVSDRTQAVIKVLRSSY